jgi:hypothetical protein
VMPLDQSVGCWVSSSQQRYHRYFLASANVLQTSRLSLTDDQQMKMARQVWYEVECERR